MSSVSLSSIFCMPASIVAHDLLKASSSEANVSRPRLGTKLIRWSMKRSNPSRDLPKLVRAFSMSTVTLAFFLVGLSSFSFFFLVDSSFFFSSFFGALPCTRPLEHTHTHRHTTYLIRVLFALCGREGFLG